MSTRFPDDDPFATRLHDALDSEAGMVTPADDGLQRIRAGIDVAHRPWWRHPATVAVAAAVVLGTAVGVGAAVLGGSDGGTVVATDSTTGGGTPSDATSTPAPTTRSVEPEPQDPPMTGSPRPAGDTALVYVYYVQNDGTGGRLYREQHSEVTAGNTPNSGLMTLFNSPPDDHDYQSLWASDTTFGYRVDGNVATVDLSEWVNYPPEDERLMVQELVYTVTANDPAVKSVRLQVNGKTPPPNPGRQYDLSKPVSREPVADVQGWIWLLSPAEGATVSSPVQISGYGTAFEGTISWEVRQGGRHGTKVAEGHTQGGSNGQFGDFHDTVDLPPGAYEIRAFEASAKDGSPQHIDTKNFTVQ